MQFAFLQVQLGKEVELHYTKSLQISPGCDASHYAKYTVWCRIKAILWVSTRNFCSLRYSFLWLVATNRRSITFFCASTIHFLSLSNVYPQTTENFKVFGRWRYKISVLSKCSNCFPANRKTISSGHVQERMFGVLPKRINWYALMEATKPKNTTKSKVSVKNSAVFS